MPSRTSIPAGIEEYESITKNELVRELVRARTNEARFIKDTRWRGMVRYFSKAVGRPGVFELAGEINGGAVTCPFTFPPERAVFFTGRYSDDALTYTGIVINMTMTQSTTV